VSRDFQVEQCFGQCLCGDAGDFGAAQAWANYVSNAFSCAGGAGRNPENRVYAPSCKTILGFLVAKHKLTKKQQAMGIRKALRSRKTPSWLKPAMRRYLARLDKATRR
jgi:hypothetical protein